jgi:hypothetical protein
MTTPSVHRQLPCTYCLLRNIRALLATAGGQILYERSDDGEVNFYAASGVIKQLSELTEPQRKIAWIGWTKREEFACTCPKPFPEEAYE